MSKIISILFGWIVRAEVENQMQLMRDRLDYSIDEVDQRVEECKEYIDGVDQSLEECKEYVDEAVGSIEHQVERIDELEHRIEQLEDQA